MSPELRYWVVLSVNYISSSDIAIEIPRGRPRRLSFPPVLGLNDAEASKLKSSQRQVISEFKAKIKGGLQPSKEQHTADTYNSEPRKPVRWINNISLICNSF